ncbi:pyridine nucleotide-disulfide oxidoreductase [Saccharomonospora sp. CUA-673]|uniref:dihydrolipoyl dehydrogenase family protein n=1 Tax=Saccharomonospora sp. CUA-673 TaxID=1904969 RepID=UPI0009692DE5|nr:NAD(P)/FAD-dependent oxidoreductase [Saccharomonospora sp. CUA-673]OLT45148.1 pyridine nucleotide-disulfide oxidoreductase [Saccharomonospora sp. CUA-673]
MTENAYDVVVIGGGPVGENAADRVVRGGGGRLDVALVEHERFGGECSYWACIPSKALLRPGSLLAAIGRMPGVDHDGRIDVDAVFARRDDFTGRGDDSGQFDWVRGAGIEPVRGHARITGEREVTVGDGAGDERVLRARHAVIVCTGSVPTRPPLPGLDGLPDELVWTSREATAASAVPHRLAVLGGGVVGTELAQAWARLGAEVHLIMTGPRPLPGYPEFAGDAVADGLREAGVRLHPDTRAESVSEMDGSVRVALSEGSVTADRLLLATGRRPATDALGLESVGLEPGRPVSVDDHGLASDVDGGWLYAAGDVTARAPLTHQGKYAARIVGDVVVARATDENVDPAPWSRHATTADRHAVPQVVFTDPEVAAVGRREAEWPGQRAVELDIAVAGSALHAEGYTGRMRAVVDTRREVLVGVTFVGQDVAELLHAATIAVVGEVPLRRLWHAVPAFPTISEVWLRLLEEYGL